MVRLGPITQEMLDSLFAEFVTTSPPTAPSPATPTPRSACCCSFLPADRVDAIMEEIRGPAGRNMWEKLSNVQEDVLANYLKNEYPQTIAVVLSKIATEHASKVLGALPEELAMDVVQRMLALDPVQKDILEKIEMTLRTEFMSTPQPHQAPRQPRADGRDLQLPSTARPRRASSPRSRSATARPPSASRR